MDQTVLGIFAIKKEGAEPTDGLEDAGIIVEVLHDFGNVANMLTIFFWPHVLTGLELSNKPEVHI